MKFLQQSTIIVILLVGTREIQAQDNRNEPNKTSNPLKLFLCGDVMTGRGIDQALPVSVNPVIFEPYMKNAKDYLKLAERSSENIETPVSYDYIWGDALNIWKENSPHLKLINLETSITTHDEPWPGKGIQYRMHPENVKVLTAAGIDYCSLGNNHVMDWSRPGLIETMESLTAADIKFSGSGNNAEEAAAPSILHTEKGRVLVYSYGSSSSGVPAMWAAEPGLSGVNFLPDLNEKQLGKIRNNILDEKRSGDVVIFSVHWSGNWGYDISERQRDFAHRLIDESGVDIIFGHSSHHPMGIEVYNGKLIIYGAGDFINDYEGISGHEQYRSNLTLMYFPEVDPATGKLVTLKLVPMKINKFRLNKSSKNEAEWLQEMLIREGKDLGTRVRLENDNSLWLEW